MISPDRKWGIILLAIACAIVIIVLAIPGISRGPEHSISNMYFIPAGTFTFGTAGQSADGHNSPENTIDENVKRMQIQGIPPPCQDIQKNCDEPGPEAAETYTQTELIEANAVPVGLAREHALIALAGSSGANAIGQSSGCRNSTLSGDPLSFYDINGMILYYRFFADNGTGSCSVLVKANKLLGAPLFMFLPATDGRDILVQQTSTAKQRVSSDHPGYRIVSSRAVFYQDFREGMQFTMVNSSGYPEIHPILDLHTFTDVTLNATSFFPVIPENEYALQMGKYQQRLSDWEVGNVTMEESVIS